MVAERDFPGAVPRVDGVSRRENLALALAGQPRAASCDVLLLFVGVVGDAEPRAVAGRDGGRSKVGRRPVTDLAADAGLEVVHLCVLLGCFLFLCWVRCALGCYGSAAAHRGAAPGVRPRSNWLRPRGRREGTTVARVGVVFGTTRGGDGECGDPESWGLVDVTRRQRGTSVASSDCHHGEAGWRRPGAGEADAVAFGPSRGKETRKGARVETGRAACFFRCDGLMLHGRPARESGPRGELEEACPRHFASDSEHIQSR